MDRTKFLTPLLHKSCTQLKFKYRPLCLALNVSTKKTNRHRISFHLLWRQQRSSFGMLSYCLTFLPLKVVQTINQDVHINQMISKTDPTKAFGGLILFICEIYRHLWSNKTSSVNGIILKFNLSKQIQNQVCKSVKWGRHVIANPGDLSFVITFWEWKWWIR